MQTIFFLNHDRIPPLRKKKRLKEFIHKLFIKERKNPGQVIFIFCSDKYLLELNKKFLKHSYYTDVIGFNLSHYQDKINAEIYISIDRVRDNALIEKVSVNEELHRVIFHGALHFCGYKDKSKTDMEKMRKAEKRYLNKYFNS